MYASSVAVLECLTFAKVHLDLASLVISAGADLTQPLALGHLLEGRGGAREMVHEGARVAADQRAAPTAHRARRLEVLRTATFVLPVHTTFIF